MKEIRYSMLMVPVLLALIGAGCSSGPPSTGPSSVGASTVAADPNVTTSSSSSDPESESDPEAMLLMGAEVLADDGFAALSGERVGVILNQTSTVHGEPLLDALARSDAVDLVAGFGPEHGVRGDAPAGAAVADSIDERTGVRVFSLYGDTKAPTATMLADLDVLLYDLQDVGARVYTYISTLGLAMQAAAAADIRFVVLDRPNPLGGGYLDGFVRDEQHESFVGQYPIPSVHGMTVGELATAIKGEGWVPGLESLELEVVPMQGWSRDQAWANPEEWVPPSPGLPTALSASVYPGTVFFEATSLSLGRGTAQPFTVVGAPWVDGEVLATELEALALPGVLFEAVTFLPEATASVPQPSFEGETVNGVRIVAAAKSFRPVEIGVHLLAALQAHAEDRGVGDIIDRPEFFDLLVGTDALRLELASGQSAQTIIDSWADELAVFEALRQPYLLYE